MLCARINRTGGKYHPEVFPSKEDTAKEMDTPNLIKIKRKNGFGLPELVVVLLVGAIILVLALPQIISSRRKLRFEGIQQEIVTVLREARQEAISQRRAITFRYDNTNKIITVYSGAFGALGDSENKIIHLSDFGVDASDIKYGRPPRISEVALDETTNLTPLTDDKVDIIFQADGSVLDSGNKPQNHALFFYYDKSRYETAFAVSVLGADGSIKVWRYNPNVDAYVE